MKSGVLCSANYKFVFAVSLLFVALCGFNSAPVFSQGSTGRILGTVTDQSGGAVAGAAVTITDTERNTSRSLVTDDAGEYNAPSLTASTYKVHVEAKGFRAIDRQNIMLEVNGSVRVDLQLQPGDVSQTITVTEEVPLVETTNAELGGTIQNNIIENLPLNGRNFENLLALRPGVSIYVGGGGWTQSTNGIRPHDNMYLVEGIDSNDPWMAQSIMNAAMAAGDAGTILPVDSIQEFKTEVNPAAEYGWKPGAVVSVGIKSGTNSFHGTAYAYGRSDAFDARNYFNPDVNTNSACLTTPIFCDKTPLSLEQFGAAVGGPVIKDKLFFFTTFESQRYDVGNPSDHAVPSLAQLEGACTAAGAGVAALSAEIAGLNPATCLPVSGQPNGNFSGLIPISPTNSLITDLNSSNRIYSGLAKADYHLNEKNTITGMYFISPGSGTFVDNAAREVAPQWLTDQYARSQVGSGAWTWTPNSTWVNEARVGYSHYYQVFESADSALNPADYSFNGTTYNIYTGQTNPEYFGLPRIRVGGGDETGFQLGLQWPKTVGPDGVLQIADTVSYLHGKHAFKFGGEILRNTSTSNVTANAKGPAQFHNLNNFFEGIAQSSPNTGFLTGNLARNMSYEGYAVFFQDDWRLTPRLTVNLGLRYELDTVFKEANNLIGNFDPSSPTGLVQVGDGISSPFNGDHNNFSPRLGFAWDVFGDGKTVVRGGGSIIYEQLSLDAFNGLANFLGLRMVPTGAQLYSEGLGGACTAADGCVQGSGTINVVATPGLAASNGVPSPTWINNSATTPLYSQSPQCGTGVGSDPAQCDILGVNRNLRTPYVTTWTLGIQRQLTRDMSLEVAYVGNHGTKLLGVTDLNQPAVGSGYTAAGLAGCVTDPADNCGASGALENQSRPYTMSCPTTNGVGLGIGNNPCFPYLQYIEWISNLDESNYNGMQVTLTQRAFHGISFTAGYTYSHALDDNGDNEGNGLHTPQVSSNPSALYANSDFDIRHRFTFSLNYAIPGRKGFGQLLEGWSINSIVTLESGGVWGVNDQTSDFTGTGESGNPLGDIGEPWYFLGNPSDFTPVHGWTDTNGGYQNGGGGVPYFSGTSNATCLAKAASISPLAVASLANVGCYAVGNSVLIPGAYGSAGPTLRNIFRDEGFKNLDLSIAKAFRFNERLSAEFKAEIFNVFNHPWFANPYGGPGGQAVDPTAQPFGFVGLTPDVQASNPVLGSGGARAMQLGLKLTF